MKVCGLTGGVGMGKSTAAGFLLARGIKVVDTDALARELVAPGQPAWREIQSTFGQPVLDESGHLRREELARIVFADEKARKKLEAILHPRIRECWLAQVESWRNEGHPLAAVIIPLLFETGTAASFDKVVCVACSSDEQQKRLLARGWTPEQSRQRIAAQMPVDQKIARAHFVVWTDGLVETQAPQWDRVLARL